MTPDQVKAIQDSFAKVVPVSEQAAAVFYGRLFEIAPEVRPLFRGDIEEQGRKLMAMLAAVVNGLGNLETILPAASALASLSVTSTTVSKPPITHRSAPLCCGRCNAASARNGRLKSQPPGPKPTRSFPAS
jgi:hemoglobin-like flavoprotein